MSSRPGLLDRIERYAAAAPVPDARIEAVGALDVPVSDPAWPFPARPRPGAGPVDDDDVRAALAVQEAAGLPPAVAWVLERHRELCRAAERAGLEVAELPLVVAVDPVELVLPAGFRLYLVGADDPELTGYQRVSDLAFAAAGSRAGVEEQPVGESARSAIRTAHLRERIASGRTVMMVVVEDGEPVAVGCHQPVAVDGGEVSEVVGLATLPRLRGHGLGAGLASALVAHARRTADLVFLSSAGDDVARVYERVGFARLATTAVATPRA